jgi:hypothetical protein
VLLLLRSRLPTSVAPPRTASEQRPALPAGCRWTGKKASSDAGGRKIDFITVGSRTSAYVPELQKLVGGARWGAG